MEVPRAGQAAIASAAYPQSMGFKAGWKSIRRVKGRGAIVRLPFSPHSRNSTRPSSCPLADPSKARQHCPPPKVGAVEGTGMRSRATGEKRKSRGRPAGRLRRYKRHAPSSSIATRPSCTRVGNGLGLGLGLGGDAVKKGPEIRMSGVIRQMENGLFAWAGFWCVGGGGLLSEFQYKQISTHTAATEKSVDPGTTAGCAQSPTSLCTFAFDDAEYEKRRAPRPAFGGSYNGHFMMGAPNGGPQTMHAESNLRLNFLFDELEDPKNHRGLVPMVGSGSNEFGRFTLDGFLDCSGEEPILKCRRRYSPVPHPRIIKPAQFCLPPSA